ncbi:hypothetical protein CR513_38922, partial [Mucuna pruriens]
MLSIHFDMKDLSDASSIEILAGITNFMSTYVKLDKLLAVNFASYYVDKNSTSSFNFMMAKWAIS